MAEIDLKLAVLKKEVYANFTAVIVGAPVPKLLDLLEEGFGGSNSEDKVEEDPDTVPLAKRPRLETPSMASSAVSSKSTMPSATASTTLLVAITLEQSHSILPVKSLPLYDTAILHEQLPTHGNLTEGKAAYYCIECTYRAQSRSTACTHVCCNHMHVSIGCPYCFHKVWSGDAWKQHMCHAHSECLWYVVTLTPTPSQQLVALPDDPKEEMTLKVLSELPQ